MNNIEKVLKRINDVVIKVTEEPITLPDGGVMFFIRDQDLNAIELHQNGSTPSRAYV